MYLVFGDVQRVALPQHAQLPVHTHRHGARQDDKIFFLVRVVMRRRFVRPGGVDGLHFEQLPAGVLSSLDEFGFDARFGIEHRFAFVSHIFCFKVGGVSATKNPVAETGFKRPEVATKAQNVPDFIHTCDGAAVRQQLRQGKVNRPAPQPRSARRASGACTKRSSRMRSMASGSVMFWARSRHFQNASDLLSAYLWRCIFKEIRHDL
jgi:hypothetical protein